MRKGVSILRPRDHKLVTTIGARGKEGFSLPRRDPFSFCSTSDSRLSSLVVFGAPGGPSPPEASDQGQVRKGRHPCHCSVWPVKGGPGGGGSGVGPVSAGQVRGRFWTGETQGTQIPDRLRVRGLRGSSALAAAAAAAAVAGGRGELGLSRAAESPSRPLFLPEETSFLGRTLTPVVLGGVPADTSARSGDASVCHQSLRSGCR